MLKPSVPRVSSPAPQHFSSRPQLYRVLSKLILGCVRASALFIATPFVWFSLQTHFGLCPRLSAFHRGPISIVFSANSCWAVSAPQRFSSRPLLNRFLSKLVLGCVRTSALFIAAPFLSFSQQTHFGLCPHISAFHRGPFCIVFSANSFWAVSAPQRFSSLPPFLSFSQQTHFGLCPHLSAFHRCPISIVFSANSFWAVSAPQRFSSLPHFYRFLSKLILGCVRTSALSIAAPFVSFSQQTRFGLCPQRFPSRPHFYRFLSKLILGCVRASALFIAAPFVSFSQQTHFGLCPHLSAFHRCPISIVFSANSFWAVSAHQRFPSRPLLNRFLSKLILGCVRASALFIAAPFESFSQQTHFGLCPHLSAFHRCPISIVFSANSFWAVSAPQRFPSRPHFYRFLSKLILGCVRASALFIAAPFLSFSQQTHVGLCPHLSAFHRDPICMVFSANSFWAMSAPQRFPIAAPFLSFSQQTHFGLCPHLSAFHRGPISTVFSANSFWAVSAPQRFSSRPPFESFSQQTHFGLCPHLSAFHRVPF